MSAAETLRVALADTWTFAFKTHAYHWNVEGPLFRQLHQFFGDIYDDVDGAIDGLAEQIRALGEMAPSSLSEISAPSMITFPGAGTADDMLTQLAEDNEVVRSSLESAQQAATEEGYDGLANYLQDRIDRHSKWGWMLKASSGGGIPPRTRLRYDHPMGMM